MMDTNELVAPFERLLADLVTPAEIRRIESGHSASELWNQLQDSGFLDVLIPEDAGGAGLTLAQAYPLFHLLGRYLVPLPVPQTMVARALLSAAELSWPNSPIVFASPLKTADGWQQNFVSMANADACLLADIDDALVLLSPGQYQATPAGIHASQTFNITAPGMPAEAARLPRPPGGLRVVGAVLRAAEIAGACDHLLQTTVDYAGQRVQFGKPIGRQQAVQQQLAVMAEQVVMARIAAQLGCAHGMPVPIAAAAAAKNVASSAVTTVTAVAHAVHGAIGISEECDVQLFVRRLHAWRLAEGSESYWAAALGTQRLASDCIGSVEFLRRCVGVTTQHR